MKYEDYYRIAEGKISEYDMHAFRCKQWLVPILSAFVLMAIHRQQAEWMLIGLGLASIILLFLVEMSFHAIHGRMTKYCKVLEKKMSEKANQEVSDTSLTIGHFVSRGVREDWCDFGRHISGMVFRVRGCLFYLAAMVILVIGVLLGSQV